MFKKIKEFKWGYVLIALVLAVIGICFIAFQEALKALAITIGVILILFSVVSTVLTIADKRRGFSFGFKIFFAVVALIGGIVTAIFNEKTIDIIIAVFSLLLIMDSSFKLHTSAMSKRFELIGWWLIMAIAALSVAGSFFLLKFTPESIKASSIILGIVMLVNAVNNFLSAFYLSGIETGIREEAAYELYKKGEEPQESLKDKK